jgi:hypothetical protein
LKKKIATIIILLLILSITWIALIQENNKYKLPTIVSIPKINIIKIDTPEVLTSNNEDELYNVLSNLKSAVESDDNNSNKLTDNEMQNVLSKLKYLQPVEPKKEIPKEVSSVEKVKIVEPKIVKKIIPKSIPTVVKVSEPTIKPIVIEPIIYKKVYVEIPSSDTFIDESTVTTHEYRRRLQNDTETEIDKDLMSLPMAQTLDMNIEEKIESGEIEELRTPKPLVKKSTISLTSEEIKIDDDIPWAKLREVDDEVEGILLKETIK